MVSDFYDESPQYCFDRTKYRRPLVIVIKNRIPVSSFWNECDLLAFYEPIKYKDRIGD